MRLTRLHVPTLKELPKDAEVASHQLMLRGGYIRKLAAGLYDYLPLATRVIRKIERIIREEMDRAGGQEILMPIVQPAEIWQESGRWSKFGPELMRMIDRKGGKFCLGPTHEEVVVDLVRRDVRSWRALPLNLYQIQTKFRDEIRPRAGLMRGREFIMKDAYSFDVDAEAANQSYDAMYAAYERIFKRCGLDFRAVEADTGAIGGSRSHEFQVLASTGEDAIVACDTCGYAANVEQAELSVSASSESQSCPSMETVETPGVRSIDEVSKFLGCASTDFLKTLLVAVDGQVIAVLLRGDHELNKIKLQRFLKADEVTLATDKQVQVATGAPVGFAGPVGLKIQILADLAVQGSVDRVVGANQIDQHLRHVAEGRDYQVTGFADLRLAMEGDSCPRCEGTLKAYQGIEVGHIFFLGTNYSEAMRCTYLDKDAKEQPMVMGCYGIGVTRIMAAAIEQNHDEHGIIWPKALAPYHVSILPLQMNVDSVVELAERLHRELQEAGVEVLLDDRKLRAGAKFADAELIGVPLRIAIGGRGLKEGIVEIKPRLGGEVQKVPIKDAVAWIQNWLA